MSIHDHIITPGNSPERFTAEERALFEEGKCCWLTSYGTPWDEYCAAPSEPGASFGHCAEHNAQMLENYYPDGSRREHCPILVTCEYCGLRAPLDQMRILGRDEGGFACRDTAACDERDDLAFYGEAEQDEDD